MNKFLLAILTIFSFLFLSCGNKKPISVGTQINLSFVEDGSVAQLSSQKINQRRLYFSYGGGGEALYSGNRQVFSHQVVNPNSLSEDLYEKYYAMVLTDSEGSIVHRALLNKNYYFEKFDKNPDYFISFYRGALFIDIPMSIELSKIKQFSLVDIKTSQVTLTVEIADIGKSYREPIKPEGWNKEFATYKIFGESEAENAFDFVILTEGFTKEELNMDSKESLMNSKFGNYVSKYILPLMNTEPYKSRKENINIWVVATPSLESGVSNPFQNKKVRTVYNSTFGAYCSERFLVVRDQLRALEMASNVPFDQVLVLMNDETYGGQGGDIATFSVHERASYLIKHELAHSIGMLADEYSNFSDGNALSNCEDNLIDSMASHGKKRWGRNRFINHSQWLAPNIDIVNDRAQVKWASFLEENSPVIEFNYPKKMLKFNEEELSLEGEYLAGYENDKILITMGLELRSNAILEFIDKVEVNGINEPFVKISRGKQIFIELEKRGMVTGEVLNLKIYADSSPAGFEDNESLQIYLDFIKKSLDKQKTDAHFVTLASNVFSGDISELGIFQGSGVSLEKTYRSSYRNIMGTSLLDFDKWQEHAYGMIIDSYFTREAQ